MPKICSGQLDCIRYQRLPSVLLINYLVDRKLVIKKVACLESVIDKRAEAVHNDDEKVNVVEPSANCMSIEYTRTLDKAYCFFKTGMYKTLHTIPCPILLIIYAFLQLFYFL